MAAEPGWSVEAARAALDAAPDSPLLQNEFLPPEETRMMAALALYQDVPAAALAARLGKSEAEVSGLLDALIARGLVSRRTGY